MLWRRLDLVAVPLVSWGLLALLNLVSLPPLQAILGLIAALFCPGYALLAALYPKQTELDLVERLALSVGLSIVLVPLLGLGMYFSPWGFRVTSTAFALAATVTVLAALAALQGRRRVSEGSPAGPGATAVGRRPASWGVVALVALALASLLGLLTYQVQRTPPRAPFSEFYVLDSEGGTERYAALLTVGVPASYTIGIANQEQQAAGYRVRVLLDGQATGEFGPITINDKQSKEFSVEVTALKPVERARLEFQLFVGARKEPDRRVQLWVRVQPAS